MDEDERALTDEEAAELLRRARAQQAAPTKEEITGGAASDVGTAMPQAPGGDSADRQGADQWLLNWIRSEVIENRGHGEYVGSPQLISKDITHPLTGQKTPNRNPMYRYKFADNTYLDVQWTGQDWNILGGTALKEATKPKTASPIVREYNDKMYQWDEEAQKWGPAPGMGTTGNWDPSRGPAPSVVDMQAHRMAEAKIKAQELANKIAEGDLERSEAEREFDKWYKSTSLETQRRGQDIDFARTISNNTTDLTAASLKHMAPPGSQASYEGALKQMFAKGGIDYQETPAAQFPFDPTKLPMEVAFGALAGISPYAAQMAGMPMQEPSGYAPSGNSSGGNKDQLIAYARQAAQKAGIDPDIFVRQIQQESGFNPNAKSPAGAMGIAQFMPGTARGVGLSDPWNPQAALDASAKLMKSYVDKYGDYSVALAAYNAGEGNVQKYGGVPPFQETQTYVRNILGGQTPRPQPQPQLEPEPPQPVQSKYAMPYLPRY